MSLKEEVARRAGYICEYCPLPDGFAAYPHQQDHIISEHLEGETTSENLALACIDCNRYKGPAIAAVDKSAQHSVCLIPERNPGKIISVYVVR